MRPSGLLMEASQSMTVLKAMALGGGPTRNAALDHARLIRKSESGPQEISVSLKKILEAKAPDVPLQADDVLFIPSSAKNAALRGMQAVLQTAAGLGLRAVY